MDTTICPLDLALPCEITEYVTELEIGPFSPLWEQFIPTSDNYPKTSSFCENCLGMGAAGPCFNDCLLSTFQSETVSSPESDRISSPVMDAGLAPDFYLFQDFQPLPDSTRTAAYQQGPSPGNSGEAEAPRSLDGNDKGSTRKLLTASRKSKNRGGKNRTAAPQKGDPRTAFAQKRARDCHNKVEKQYRDRLNSQYTTLLNMIPATSRADSEESGSANTDESLDLRGKARNESRGVSRGEILDAARQYIQTLEREEEVLQGEREQLLKRAKKMCPNE